MSGITRISFYSPGTQERHGGEPKINRKVNLSGHKILQSRATATVGDKGELSSDLLLQVGRHEAGT